LLGPSPRILVIRLRRFGDLLLITPTLRAIRLAYPNARLDVLASAGFHHALLGNRQIDELLVLRPGFVSLMRLAMRCRRGRYDAVLDLQSSGRSLPLVLSTGAPVRVGWRKRWARDWVFTRRVPGWDDPVYVAGNTLRMAAAVDVPPPPDLRLELAVSAADRARAAALCERAGVDPARPFIALSVVANVPRKAWPLERYAQLADWLVQTHGAQLLLSSAAKEVSQVETVVARMRERPLLWNYGETSLHELGALYERCQLWIGNDGGPKHVATAVGCPTVVIIKPGDERFWTDGTEGSGQLAVRPAPGARPLDSPTAISVDDVQAVVDRCLASLDLRRAGRTVRSPLPG
jgi:ADP-heptose:LPS heptosyltransferase